MPGLLRDGEMADCASESGMKASFVDCGASVSLQGQEVFLTVSDHGQARL